MAEKQTDKFEREYVIPLRAEWSKTPRYKRANKAIRAIKEFLVRHMKVYDRDLNKIKIDKYLNEEIWFRGIKKPPAKIKVRAIKNGEIVRVELFALPDKLKFKKAREEKREEGAAKKKTEHVHAGEQKPEEKTEEQKKNVEEKKASTVEATEKFEKQEHKKAQQQKGAKVDKRQQVQTKKKDLKGR